MITNHVIGVFDSGVGGQSVANAIKRALPDCQVIYVDDKTHVPYGSKKPEELRRLVLPILLDLQEKGCEVIVVACNTVTTTLIDELRQTLKVPLIGMEPMVKPAARQTKTGVIAVCATPTTLSSPRYRWLKQTYTAGIKVVEPDCSDWSRLIEQREIDRHHIEEQIESALGQNADVIILGCTHYHWIEELICRIVDERAEVIQPEQAVINRLKEMLGITASSRSS